MKKLIQKGFQKVGIKSDRTKNISKHVLLSFIYKGGSIMANFLLVPITINYLDTENYGIWLTLSSFIAWFSFFDIGLGNGLRNKFAEAKVDGNIKLAQGYVSSAYFTIGALSCVLIIIFIGLNFFIDWTKVFNSSLTIRTELSILMPIVFGFFCIQLIVKLITTIYTADQNHSMQGKINFVIQVSSLIIIWFITKTSKSSLLIFGTIFSMIPVLILIFINFYAFNNKYIDYKPSIKLWKNKYLKDIFGLGFRFFIIQIAAIILFSADNFIIAKYLGPKEVVPFNIAYKYFSIVTMVYSLIITPFWSSFTEAYSKNDYEWIKKSVSNIQKIWFVVPIFLIFMILISKWFYNIWVGENILIELKLTVAMAIYVLLLTFNYIYVQFINGTGKLKIQLLTSIISVFLNIPLSIYFATNLEMGSSGVILGSCICLIFSVILYPIQYFKIINKNQNGLWNE